MTKDQLNQLIYLLTLFRASPICCSANAEQSSQYLTKLLREERDKDDEQ